MKIESLESKEETCIFLSNRSVKVTPKLFLLDNFFVPPANYPQQNCGYQMQSSHSLLWDIVIHIFFVVTIKTTGGILSKIWNQKF